MKTRLYGTDTMNFPHLLRLFWMRPAWRRDLFIVFAITLATYALSIKFELSEKLVPFTRTFEKYQIDELPIVLIVMLLSMIWFSWRRWKETGKELSRRRAVETELEKSERQYRLLFIENFSGNLLASPDGIVRLCNPAMARILGCASPEQAVGRSLEEFYAQRELWRTHLRLLHDGKRVELDQLQLVNTAGAPVTVMAKMMANFSADTVTELHIYLTDISELKSMEQELADTLAQNRQLSHQQILLQEEERKTMARELHDELGQYLNAIKLDAVFIRDQTGDRAADVHSSAESIVEISTRVYDVVRSMMRRLRPVALDELGLTSALEHMVQSWRERLPSIAFTLRIETCLEGFSEVLNITLYRLVQEALTNVAKHARASNVSIVLNQPGPDGLDTGCILLSIRDDGVGVDLHDERKLGLGIVGMRERVEALGGKFEIDSASGRGLCLRAAIPITD
jgi:PAS domain S-box-containing protein